MSWADLPQTFKDAIDFSQKLDLKYIWIDSPCIPQDERADWHREAAQMRNTYKNAYVTLAATASADGQGGCYRIQQYRSEKIAEVKVDGSFVEVHTRRAWRHLGEEVPWKQWEDISAPLLQRAWAFQERLLSPRSYISLRTRSCGSVVQSKCASVYMVLRCTKSTASKV
jgi:hypothetical protein